MKRVVAIFLLIVSVISSLIGIEVVLRILDLESKEIWWKWATNSDQESLFRLDSRLIWSLEESRVRVYGDTDSNNEKTIVAMVGDSFTYGFGDQESIELNPAHFLAEKLGTSGNYLVYNYGTPGYGVGQEYLLLKNKILPELKPDIVIWNINPNDLFDTRHRSLHILRQDSLVEIPGWAHGIYLQGLLQNRLPYLYQHSKLINQVAYLLQSVDPVSILSDTSDENTFQKIQAMLLEIDQGHPLLLISQTPNQFFFSALKGTQHDHALKNRKIIDLLAQNPDLNYYNSNLEISNLLSAEESSASASQLLFANDKKEEYGWKHLSPEGNQYYAESIYQQLVQRGMIKN